METLKERLVRFHEWTKKGVQSLDVIGNEFLDIARWFLYGGYIEVCNESGLLYKIHIHAVEFYFHCEVGCKWGIKDPIVYHSNLKRMEEEIEKDKVPYFPLMTLNAQIHTMGEGRW